MLRARLSSCSFAPKRESLAQQVCYGLRGDWESGRPTAPASPAAMVFEEWTAKAFGLERMKALDTLREGVVSLDEQSREAGTLDVTLVPLHGTQAKNWVSTARARDEAWAYLASADKTTILAIDEVTMAGDADHSAAVVYPEIHMRLVSWWLVHAWRSVDLLQDTLDSLGNWRITSSAVTARAVIEEAGCLADEAIKLTSAWSTAKSISAVGFTRALAVRESLIPMINQAAFGSRLKRSPTKAQATNVLTYVKKLASATKNEQYAKWYDWLSDAAHPAFGARIALGASPLAHESGAVVVRYYARSPMHLESASGEKIDLPSTIALDAADATIAAGTVICSLLQQALRVVDDVGLTTAASTYTTRQYWRDFKPVRGSRQCPCGRGKWGQCGHRWGSPAPNVVIRPDS